MIKIGYHLLDFKVVFFMFLALIASPLLCGQNTFTMCLIFSHYITVYLNNFFLLFLYQYVYRFHQLMYPMIMRIGQETFYIMSYIWVVGLGFIYNFILYISYYFFFGPLKDYEVMVSILFMISNLMMCGLECSFVYLQLGKKKNFIYLALPIFMNFIFHFIWLECL